MGHAACRISTKAEHGLTMADNNPDRRLVLPANCLKIGPDLSSSHCKQSFNWHVGAGPLLLPPAVVAEVAFPSSAEVKRDVTVCQNSAADDFVEEMAHSAKHSSAVWALFMAQIFEQSWVMPRSW